MLVLSSVILSLAINAVPAWAHQQPQLDSVEDDTEMFYEDAGTQFKNAVALADTGWSELGEIEIAPDDWTHLEDVDFQDKSDEGSGYWALWKPGIGADDIWLFLEQMNGPTSSTAKRREVIAHEMGHALGIDHHAQKTQRHPSARIQGRP